MKFPRYFYTVFALLLITGALFSGCGQQVDDNAVPDNSESAMTQSTPDTSTQQTSEVLGSPQQGSGSSMDSQQMNDGSSTQMSQETQKATAYKNGVYSEKASYTSPAGNEDVTFKFTVANNAISDLEMSSPTTNPLSKKFQGFFMEGIKQEVIGKKINDLGTFSRVNGSSLTPDAFNQALNELKQKAQA